MRPTMVNAFQLRPTRGQATSGLILTIVAPHIHSLLPPPSPLQHRLTMELTKSQRQSQATKVSRYYSDHILSPCYPLFPLSFVLPCPPSPLLIFPTLFDPLCLSCPFPLVVSLVPLALFELTNITSLNLTCYITFVFIYKYKLRTDRQASSRIHTKKIHLSKSSSCHL